MRQTGSARVDLDDLVQHQQFIEKMLSQESWGELEALVSQERSSKSRFPGGSWKLNLTYCDLAAPMIPEDTEASEADWLAQADRLARWAAAKPDSITARVALAEFYVNYAWNARGEEFDDLVGDDARKIFDERMEKARNILIDSSKLPTRCPEWYRTMLDVAIAQGWPLEDQRKLFEEAISLEPLYYYYYQEYSIALLPQWYGEIGDSERFADEIARRVPGKQGAIVYFEIAARLICKGCGEPTSRLKLMSWERIQQGYAAEVELYGNSSYKLNAFAKLAMRLDDWTLAAALFSRIGDDWSQDVWHSKYDFLLYRQTAYGMPEEVVQAFQASFNGFQNPNGIPYQQQLNTDLHQRLDQELKNCVATIDHDAWSYSVFLRIGPGGQVEQALSWPPTRVANCLAPKITAQHFAVPPEPSFWTYANIGDVKPPPFLYEGEFPDVGK